MIALMPVREPKIYLLPNLMTAGNLFCGFMAVIAIFNGMLVAPADPSAAHPHYIRAILFIFGACIFDLLDGRMARIGGRESPFGREFDSLADVVSFGLAPALLVFKVVLVDLPGDMAGSMIAFLYLLCGAMRLARFNCMAADAEDAAKVEEVEPGVAAAEQESQPLKEFVGLPIPMAAGTIAAITIFLIWLAEGERELGPWKYLLAVLMVCLALLMMSHIRYPSFKKVHWRSRASLPWVAVIFLVILITVRFYQVMPAVICVAYITYGFARPWVSQRTRAGIESPFSEEDEP
jgi:CDP-diacylglycerol--serine O-phosphatidyltransferase